jgi:hypothetical protein
VSLAKEYKLVNAALDNYRAQLDTIPDDEFDVTPSKGGWSYAEVYSHIMQATLLSFIAIDRCTTGNKPTKDGLNFWGRYVMLLQRFPPGKLKVPEKASSKMPVTKISKEEAKNLIIKCRKRVEEAFPAIHNVPLKNRSKHPRLGMLNAAQWLKFIRIHLQHHLKQLKRIDRNFSTKG